ncbi:MAG: hypothetical protein ACRDGO_05565 [Actinomycetota bacterium]
MKVLAVLSTAAGVVLTVVAVAFRWPDFVPAAMFLIAIGLVWLGIRLWTRTARIG